MATSIIVALAPLAEQLITDAIAYEKARKAINTGDAPTAAQIVSSINITDAQIEQTADTQLGTINPTTSS